MVQIEYQGRREVAPYAGRPVRMALAWTLWLVVGSWSYGQGLWGVPFTNPPVPPLPTPLGVSASDLRAADIRRLPPMAEPVPGLSDDGLRIGNHERFISAPNSPANAEDDLRQQVAQLQQEWQAFQAAEAREKPEAASRPTWTLAGQVQVDALWFSQDATSRAAVGDVQDSLDLRRVRLGVRGEVFEVYDYSLGLDFAQGVAGNGRPQFLDVFWGRQDVPLVGNVRIGHFYEPFSLERLTWNRNDTFLEYSVADAFAPGRNTGLLIFDWAPEERRTYALGIFRSGSDGFGDDAGDREGLSVTGRVTCCPIYDEANDGRTYLHLGIGSSYRHAGDDGVCYRTRPEVFGRSESKGISTPYFADTGTLVARDSALLGTEFAWIAGPFSVQVEYMLASVDRPGAPDTLFHGGYLGLSYFLTGEHRPYDRQRASMDRVIPHANFLRIGGADGSCATGPGAWELAARISYVDLSDRDVDGGGLTDFTAGVNWYLTGYHRIKAHYVRAHLVRGPTGSSDTGIFALRFDMDF